VSGEPGDELGVRLYNASGGRIKYQPHKLAALRKTGLADDRIVEAFERFVGYENARRTAGGWHGRWGTVGFRFLRWLKDELSPAELDQFKLPRFAQQDGPR
jgi:hypothetical protein